MKKSITANRERLNMSTSELAQRLGVSQSSVVRLEQSEASGGISLSSLQRAAQALGCDLEYTLRPTSKLKKKPYKGLTRIRGTFEARQKSPVGERLRRETERDSNRLSSAQRILQACRLSELSKELRACATRS